MIGVDEELTADQALDGLEKAVAWRGKEFRYRNHFPNASVCKYVDVPQRGGPVEAACIAGAALAMLGWSTDRLQRLRNASIDSLYAGGDLKLTWGAVRVLGDAQALQDGGDTWGEALEAARVALHEVLV